jgi:RimJ/RimL family protein N-acetyltransferase
MNDYIEHKGDSSKPWDEAKTKTYLEGVRGNYWKATPAGHGPATYIIRLRSQDHAPIGYISYFRRNSDVSGEIGYGLLSEHYGCGYATEAGKEALRHWKEDVGIKIFAAASSDNLASTRVLEKLGFVPGGYVMVTS